MTSPTPTSSPNTAPAPGTELVPAPPLPPARAGGALTRAGEPTVVDAQVASLQGELVDERDGRRQERWAWATATGALMMIIAFNAAGVTGGTIFALAYFMFVIIYGRICGVEGVEQALSSAKSLLPGGGKDEEKKGE